MINDIFWKELKTFYNNFYQTNLNFPLEIKDNYFALSKIGQDKIFILLYDYYFSQWDFMHDLNKYKFFDIDKKLISYKGIIFNDFNSIYSPITVGEFFRNKNIKTISEFLLEIKNFNI